MSNDEVRIGVHPFWRWAVVPAHRRDIPGIGYWSRAAAEEFKRDHERVLPFAPRPLLLKRKSWRTYEVVEK